MKPDEFYHAKMHKKYVQDPVIKDDQLQDEGEIYWEGLESKDPRTDEFKTKKFKKLNE